MCSHLIRHKYTNFESRIDIFVYLCICDLHFLFFGWLQYLQAGQIKQVQIACDCSSLYMENAGKMYRLEMSMDSYDAWLDPTK